MASNEPSKKRQRDDRIDFDYTGREAVPIAVTHLRFHPSVTVVKNYTFENYKQLREIVFNEGLESIMMSAFRGCECLQSITLPSTVSYISMYAFSGCSSLREVVLNDGLYRIDNEAFASCSSLQSINLPSSVAEIGHCSFQYCNNLREVTINEGLVRIGNDVFSGTKVERLCLPSTLTEAREFACSMYNLEMIEFDENIPDTIQRYALSKVERFKYPDLSSRLTTVIEAGQVTIEDKIREIPGVEWGDNELVVPSRVRRIRNTWPLMGMKIVAGVDIEKLEEVKRWIAYYEMKEATTLFELALWKAKIDQRGANDTSRKTYRTEVPGPVKDTILYYLYSETDFNWAGAG